MGNKFESTLRQLVKFGHCYIEKAYASIFAYTVLMSTRIRMSVFFENDEEVGFMLA